MTRHLAIVGRIGELSVHLPPNERCYFSEDAQPDVGDWIVFEPDTAVSLHGVRRLPADGWRPAELTDLLDRSLQVRHASMKAFVSSFDSQEVVEFFGSNMQEMLSMFEDAVAAAPFDDGAAAQTELEMPTRILSAPVALPGIVQRETLHAATELHRAELAEIGSMPMSTDQVERLLDLGRRCSNFELAQSIEWAMASTLESLSLGDAELEGWLRRIGSGTAYRSWPTPSFWSRVAQFYFFPANDRGSTIEISAAHELRFQPNHQAVTARRVGRLRPGRPHLRVVTADSRRPILIGATRRLMMEVANAGGELRRMGVTFTVGRGGNEALNETLVEVEQLELLATLNPKAAVARLGRVPADDDPIAVAAARAESDHRWGHVLADLLIEEKFSIDADVIRRMIRSARVF